MARGGPARVFAGLRGALLAAEDLAAASRELERWGITALGSVAPLRGRTVALFSSVRCPGVAVAQSYQLAVRLRDAGVTVIGGFHSPMERECLRLLLRGRQPVIVCPARGLGGPRLPAEWKQPLAEGRLLLLSPFEVAERRATAPRAGRRNALVAALADEILVAHAEPGGKTERLCREALRAGTPVLTLPASGNLALAALGARSIEPARGWPGWRSEQPGAPLFELPEPR